MCRACSRNDAARLLGLLDLHAPIADYDLRTPLHIAMDDGAAACAACLVLRGSSLFFRDRWGKSPLRSGTKPALRAAVLLWASYRRQMTHALHIWRTVHREKIGKVAAL